MNNVSHVKLVPDQFLQRNPEKAITIEILNNKGHNLIKKATLL